MEFSADNFSGVTRLNCFISVWGENRQTRKADLGGGEKWGDGERVRACFVSV